jgi:4-amino-4-deoxy-L-arabinose transferase-like glycosyltransferase
LEARDVDEAPQGERTRLLTVAAALLLLIGSALRIYHLDSQSLWIDELFTLRVVDAPWLSWHSPESNLPPLYYLLAHLCVRCGAVDAWHVRWPACIAGLATVPVAGLLGYTAGGRRVAMWSLALTALSPWMLWYAQEARPYSVCMLVGAVSALCLLGYHRDQQVRWLLGLAVVLAVGLWSHPYGVWTALAAAVALRCEGAPWPRAGLAPGLAAAAYTPWLVHLWRHPPGPVGFERPFSWAALPYALFEMLLGKSFGPTTAELHTHSGLQLAAAHPLATSLGLVACAASLWLAAHGSHRAQGRVLLWLALLPLPIEWALSALVPHLAFNPRYAAASIVPLWVAVALGGAGVGPAHDPKNQTAVTARGTAQLLGHSTWLLGGLVGLELWSVASLLALPCYQKEAVGAVAQRLSVDGRGTLIATSDPLVRALVRYYYRGNLPVVLAAQLVTSPPPGPQAGVPYRAPVQSQLAMPAGRNRASPGSSPPTVVWVIESRPWTLPAWSAQRSQLLASSTVLDQIDEPGVHGWLLQRHTPP